VGLGQQGHRLLTASGYLYPLAYLELVQQLLVEKIGRVVVIDQQDVGKFFHKIQPPR
jgi:hypothetical protein